MYDIISFNHEYININTHRNDFNLDQVQTKCKSSNNTNHC